MKLHQNFACQVSVNKSLHAYCACSLVFAHVFMVFIQVWSLEYSREKKFIQDLLRCRSKKKFKAWQGPGFRTALDSWVPWQRCDWWNSSCLKRKFWPHFSVSYPFQRFIPVSEFYPHFSVLSPFQCFIPISAFYPRFSVLSPF